jgi:hypothetical protein
MTDSVALGIALYRPVRHSCLKCGGYMGPADHYGGASWCHVCRSLMGMHGSASPRATPDELTERGLQLDKVADEPIPFVPLDVAKWPEVGRAPGPSPRYAKTLEYFEQAEKQRKRLPCPPYNPSIRESCN